MILSAGGLPSQLAEPAGLVQPGPSAPIRRPRCIRYTDNTPISSACQTACCARMTCTARHGAAGALPTPLRHFRPFRCRRCSRHLPPHCRPCFLLPGNLLKRQCVGAPAGWSYGALKNTQAFSQILLMGRCRWPAKCCYPHRSNCTGADTASTW